MQQTQRIGERGPTGAPVCGDVIHDQQVLPAVVKARDGSTGAGHGCEHPTFPRNGLAGLGNEFPTVRKIDPRRAAEISAGKSPRRDDILTQRLRNACGKFHEAKRSASACAAALTWSQVRANPSAPP